MITSLQPLIMIVWLELGGGNYGLINENKPIFSLLNLKNIIKNTTTKMLADWNNVINRGI